MPAEGSSDDLAVRWARWRAMGTDVSVIVVGGPADATRRAVARLEDLEQRWSRFRPDSEVSRLNGRAGTATAVSDDTVLLVQYAVDAWRATGGRFDPTVGRAVVAAGYDRTFEALSSPVTAARTGLPAGGWTPVVSDAGGVIVDPVSGEVTLPVDVWFDPGAIGKGLAADLLAAELRDAGAVGVCVDVGGDVRVVGPGPDGDWEISVADPIDDRRDLCTVRMAEGAVATSSTLRRRWTIEDDPAPGSPARRSAHHLIDPATGSPSDRDLVSVTVVAANAATAEVLATAAIVAGSGVGPDLVTGLDAAAALIDVDGRVLTAGPFDRFLALGPPSSRRPAVGAA